MSGMVPGDFGWMSHMLLGDFESAWRLADAEREQRLRKRIAVEHWPRHLRPVWDASPLDGKHVLVRCFHGLGDTIHWIRYAPSVTEKSASVTVEAQPELVPLLSKTPGIDRLVPLPTPDNEATCSAYGCDVEIETAELPHAFRSTLATIPNAVPYLFADRDRHVFRSSGLLRVGLVWAAGAWKPERSLRFDELAPLANVPGVTFVSLQRGPAAEAWRPADQGPSLFVALDSDDVAATARIIFDLDLVISVDTMVAHLAGALGVPVWLMLHHAADWRWLLERDDSPWYPTMRLFRQSRPGDWADVVTAVVTALRGFADTRSAEEHSARQALY
jgi:hypothetical protein